MRAEYEPQFGNDKPQMTRITQMNANSAVRSSKPLAVWDLGFPFNFLNEPQMTQMDTDEFWVCSNYSA